MRWAGLVERAASWALLTLDLYQGPGKPCNTQARGDDSYAHLNLRTAAQKKDGTRGQQSSHVPILILAMSSWAFLGKFWCPLGLHRSTPLVETLELLKEYQIQALGGSVA